MKKKVLHVINSLMPGGAETLLVNSLSEGGLQNYTDNTIVYFQGTSSLANRIDKNIKIYCLNYKGIFSLPGTLLKLRKIIKENKINIVHSHLNPAGVYTHLVCPKDILQVHTLHTTYSKDTETKSFKLFMEKELYFKKKGCNIILLSEFIKADFLSTISFKGRAFVLNNFVADSFFKSSVKQYDPASGSLKLVAVGRLSEVKNFNYLLDVFMRLKDREIYLDIYGAGDIQKYQRRIKEAGIKVTMKGHNRELTDVLSNYDLFIMSSKFEGFPLSLFEAMASGVPLMLTDIPSLKSIVNEHALYFHLGDVTGTAQMICNIADGKTDINNMATKAMQFAQQTARRDKYINKLLAIYEQL